MNYEKWTAQQIVILEDLILEQKATQESIGRNRESSRVFLEGAENGLMMAVSIFKFHMGEIECPCSRQGKYRDLSKALNDAQNARYYAKKSLRDRDPEFLVKIPEN